MDYLTLAAAQLCVRAGDVAHNLQRHEVFIQQASALGVDVLIFPELSLTGYEPQLLSKLALDINDARLQTLQNLAQQEKMHIIVGAPLRNTDVSLQKSLQNPQADALSPELNPVLNPGLNPALNPLIASIIFTPDGKRHVYTKQFLHQGESDFASTRPENPLLFKLNLGMAYSPAICADTSHIEHPKAAKNAGANIYLASMLVSKNGYEADAELLKNHAQTFNLNVLMCNFGAPSGGYDCAGQSAFWAAGGEKIVAAQGVGDCLVVAKYDGIQWLGEVFG